MIKLNLSPLLNGTEKILKFEDTIVFDDSFLANTEIVSISPVNVSGSVTKIGDDSVNLKLYIGAVIELPDALTLENVSFPVNIAINKNIGNSEDEGEYYKIVENSLDILPIVWENIVLEVPLRIVKDEKDTIIEGDGWSLNKVEDVKPLGELSELLDMEE